MARRFAHEEAYRGSDLLKKLSSKQVVICGAGALGSNLADLLSRQGVTQIRVIDFDRVEAHNINTQLFGASDVGAMKVAALKNRLFRDSEIEVDAIDKELTSKTIKKALKDADLVLDCFDNTAARQLLYSHCMTGIPCLHGGMFEGYGEIVWNRDYTVPQESAGAKDVCDYPLTRNLAMLVVTVMAEEAMDFLLHAQPGRDVGPRYKSWSITLKDLSIRPYR